MFQRNLNQASKYSVSFCSVVNFNQGYCNAAVLEDIITIDRADVPTIINTASIDNAHKSDLNIIESRTVDNDHRICDGLFNVISNQPSGIHDNKIIIDSGATKSSLICYHSKSTSFRMMNIQEKLHWTVQ